MPGADREAEGSSENKARGQKRQWLYLHGPEVGVQDMSPLLQACVLCQFLGTTQELVMCMTVHMWWGVEGHPNGGELSCGEWGAVLRLLCFAPEIDLCQLSPVSSQGQPSP